MKLVLIIIDTSGGTRVAGAFSRQFLYSVNLTEYVAMDPRVSVCVSVCLCVCVSVCVISTAQTNRPILMKLSTNHLLCICSIRFSPILKIQI